MLKAKDTVHCDHMVHGSVDLSSWLDSPIGGATIEALRLVPPQILGP